MTMKPLKIGPVTIDPPTVMAPLAGITNLPFRLMVKEANCGLVCSEMISSNGLVYNSGKTRKMIESDPSEKPLSVQLFGSKPDLMAEAATMIEDSGADIIDINFGCSVKKVLKTGSGSALMKTPETAEAILKAVRKAITIPLTIKIRSGWDTTGRQAFDIAKLAEHCGVDAIALHPRTATQGFGGTSDWNLIAELKKRVSIPVIGNGDIKAPEDAMRMFDETACDGVMIGRAAIGDPDLFERTARLISGEAPIRPDINKHFDMMEHYLEETVRYLGEEVACKMMRSRLGWFVKGIPGCSTFRNSAVHISSHGEALDLIKGFRNYFETVEGIEKLGKSDRFKPIIK